MGRFRIKSGEIEIEYEGEDSKEKYEAAFDWVRQNPAPVAPARPPSGAPAADGEEKKKEDRRGGQRSAVISPAIDKLLESGWFGEHRKNSDIVQELKNRGTPGVSDDNVNAACMRRVRDGKLETILDEGQRVFWAKARPG